MAEKTKIKIKPKSEAKAAVILDRDGVINHDSKDYIKSLDEFKLISGSVQAIADLHKAGWPVFVITNQSGLERGLYDEQTLAEMHKHLYQEVFKQGGDIQAIYYCPHHPDSGCECRKPKPGLFKQLALEHQIDLSQSYYVGDKSTDIEVALRVQAQPILVRSGQGQQNTQHALVQTHLVPVYADLKKFVKQLLSN